MAKKYNDTLLMTCAEDLIRYLSDHHTAAEMNEIMLQVWPRIKARERAAARAVEMADFQDDDGRQYTLRAFNRLPVDSHAWTVPGTEAHKMFSFGSTVEQPIRVRRRRAPFHWVRD